jgi:hypothetical protein
VAFFQSGNNTLRVSFDDRTTPSTALWEDKSAPTVQQFVLSDPIGFVDRQTGRVFSLDLLGGEGNSLAAFSDDDGNSWTPMQGGGSPAGPDHETLGGGPFNNSAVPAPPPHPLYPNAIYYCSQNIAGGAECSRSDDGGLTFGPGVDIFTPTQCYGGIHGHVKVAPDGTVYVPNSSCTSGNGGSQGMAVSRDNGLTWHDSTVPTSTGSGDPSVGIDADNNVFIGYVNADGRPHIAVSSNHGDSWSRDYDVGVPVGCNAEADPNPAYAPCRIKGAVFPVVVAGEKGRAAFGFVGTTTGGNYQDEATFQGIWYFYVATTYDGGNTWSTVNATPGDPVQKGSICLGGLTCGNDRNLLDFNDMSIDREGRVLAAYADGCVASAGCVAPNYSGRSSKAAIVRQTDGRRMFAAFDAGGTPTPTPTPTPSVTPTPTPITDCMEDDDARIAYSDGWHNGTSINASSGHFRWHQGKSTSHTVGVDFSVPANGTGTFSYRYAKSTKGGTAQVFIDGVSRGTINYKGTSGSDKAPEFASGGVAYEARYEGLGAGAHRFELRNMADSVFVDGFCLTVTVPPQAVTSSSGGTTQSSFTGTPTSGPGQSTSNDSSVNAGQESKSNVTLGTNARAISIVAETNGDLPVKLALVSPTGLTLQIVDAVNGVAVLSTPVTQGGIYTAKVINVNVGPVQVWTVATPTIAR